MKLNEKMRIAQELGACMKMRYLVDSDQVTGFVDSHDAGSLLYAEATKAERRAHKIWRDAGEKDDTTCYLMCALGLDCTSDGSSYPAETPPKR